MAFQPRSRRARFIATVVAASLIVPPLPWRAGADAATLAEAPLRNLDPARPNVVLTIDDAGHTSWDFAPDHVAYAGAETYHCRDRRHCGGATVAPGPGYTPSQLDPPLRSVDYNRLYYDPAIDYAPGRRDDGSNLPCEGSNMGCAGPWTAVYVNGFAGYPAPNTGAVADLATGFSDTAWCWKSAPTPAEIQTAFTDGSICRRNGIGYAQAGTSPELAPAIRAGYNYPNAIDPGSGQATTCSPGEQCRFVHPFRVTGNPYYYAIAAVGYCATADAAGWGSTDCTRAWDAAARRHVRFGSAPFDAQAFTRVDITPAGILINGVPGANPSGRSYAAEMANFAVWYAFHRTRMLAMKTAAGIAFSTIGPEARVGFHTLSASIGTAGFVNVADFTPAQKATWYAHLYESGPALTGVAGAADALWRIGEYFANRGSALPAAGDPLHPVAGRCQSNHHLFAMSGLANVSLDPAHAVGDQDRIVPSLPAAVPQLVPGFAFPRPLYEGPASTSDTLADLAMNYWVHDLRADHADQGTDPFASWQHLVLHTFSLGARGSLAYPAAIDAITSRAMDWPASIASGGPDAIDDMWHAAVNGHGRFAYAETAEALAAAFVGALAEVTGAAGTAAAITISSTAAGARYGYRTSYSPGDWGDVRKYALDPDTGTIPLDANGHPTSAPVWSAAAKLDAQAAVTGAPPAQDAGWDTRRRIVTIDDATGAVVPFRLGRLSAGQRASLTAGWPSRGGNPTPQQVLDYLRGDRSNEGNAPHQFRVRPHLLGDIVHSAAVPVGAPSLLYAEAGNPGYAAFRTARRNRTPMVYVGANDGMLHAIVDAEIGPDAGTEAWAYVPKALFSAGDPNDRPNVPSPAFQLGALAYRPGGTPAYAHRFYVDATPRVWDVDFANTNTSAPPDSGNDWRTLLVGGLGAGARAVYALDVTDPVAPSESEDALASSGRVLWEFTHANLGYVSDPPTLVKTRRYGWVALIASGHNNPGGEGKLFVVNPANGALLTALSTGVGSDAAPSGFAAVRAYTANRTDGYAEQAYGGDLEGNLWRFDFASADENEWKIERIARLTDASGRPQPVTAGVRIEIDPATGVDRYVLVGTGKLLAQADLGDASRINTMYAIRDGTRTAPDVAPATPWSRADLNAVDAAGSGGFGSPAAGTRGWYMDATDPNQKIVTDVHAVGGAAVFAFSKPATDPCGAALEATLFARDFATARSVLLAPGGTSGSGSAATPGGAFVPGISIAGGLASIETAPRGSVAAGAASADAHIALTTLRGQLVTLGIRSANAGTRKHRVAWRLLNVE